MSDWTYEIIEMTSSSSEWIGKPKDGVPSILKIKFQKVGELDRIITYTFNDEQILNTTTFNTKEK